MKKLIRHIIHGMFNSTIFNMEIGFLASLLILPILITLSMIVRPDCFSNEAIATPSDVKTLGVLIAIDIAIIIVIDTVTTLIDVIEGIKKEKEFCKKHHLKYKFDEDHLLKVINGRIFL